jgi:hypothetical protein
LCCNFSKTGIFPCFFFFCSPLRELFCSPPISFFNVPHISMVPPLKAQPRTQDLSLGEGETLGTRLLKAL